VVVKGSEEPIGSLKFSCYFFVLDLYTFDIDLAYLDSSK